MRVPKKQRAECAVYCAADGLLWTSDLLHVLSPVHYCAPAHRILLNQLVWLDILVKNMLLRQDLVALVIDAKFVALDTLVRNGASVDQNTTSRAVQHLRRCGGQK